MQALVYFLVAYGILALGHVGVQIWLGHLEHRRQCSQAHRQQHHGHRETVSVVVPVYNEDPVILEECIKALYAQDYAELEIIVVDDGSKTRKALDERIYKKYNHGRLRYILLDRNVGKRHAQKYAFDVAKGDIIVTVDSDTVLRSPQAVATIVRRFKDPRVGGVTGDVRVANHNVNLLTKLIGYRYWMAFHQERAAQSFFYVLMCCSGPFSAYRKHIVDDVKERYVSQRFLNKLCTYGDDRHLTNLVLLTGHQVVFDNTATAYTYVPETLGTYLRQQVRWNKSFYREMLWTYRMRSDHHLYLLYDLTMQLVLPFLLLAALVITVVLAVATGPAVLYQYVVTLVGIALLRALYGIYRTRDVGFLLFAVYGFMHVGLLLPTRLYALCTMRSSAWGTR